MHGAKDGWVRACLHLGPGPVEQPEGWIRVGEATHGAVPLDVLLEFGSPGQGLLGGDHVSDDYAAGRAGSGGDVGGDRVV